MTTCIAGYGSCMGFLGNVWQVTPVVEMKTIFTKLYK